MHLFMLNGVLMREIVFALVSMVLSGKMAQQVVGFFYVTIRVCGFEVSART